ncbi:MAG TPA: TonB-dependent receptor [Bryobacteraceae bacterium]|nr:TonB-dependent receptor [Bryobacteraceae bacterium]
MAHSRFALLFLLLATFAVNLFGQAGTSFTLQGTLLDESGAVIPGGTVTVKNTSLGLTRTAQSDSQGHYLVAALPPAGQYEISVQAKGFAPQTSRGLTFGSGVDSVVDFTLKPGTVTETVEISAEAPLVEGSKSDISHVVGTQQLVNLPDNGRNFFDFVTLTPGAVVQGGGSGAVTINGQGIRELTILADGIPNQLREIRTLGGDLAGANGTFSLDVVQEVQVVTNNFSAEYGRSMSGVVNSITRTGTNDWHGDAFINGRPGEIDAGNPLTKANPDLVREQWGGTIGGPIVTDRMHFIGNYEQTHQTQIANGITSILEPNPGTPLNVPFSELKAFGKVDQQINANNRIDFRYSLVRSESDNAGVGGLNTSQRADDAVDRTQNIESSAISVLTPRLVNEARFAFTRDLYFDFQAIVGIGLPPDFSKTGPAINRSGIGNLGPDPSLPQDLNEKGYTWQDKLTYTRGKHNLKFGGEATFYNRFVTFYNNFTGTYTFAAGTPTTFNPNDPKTFPTSYTQAFGKSGLNYDEWLYGIYFQDDYNVTRGLTLNFGLRYDYETLMHDTQNFAPRFGFAWDPKKNGKTVIRGGAGLFYATIESSLVNRESNNGPNGIFTLSLTPGDPLFPTFPNRLTALPTGAKLIFSDVFIPITRGLSQTDFPLSVGDKFGGLRVNPYSEQASLNIQRSVTPNLLFEVDYVVVKGLKLLRTEDLNLPPFFPVYPGHTRTQAQADAQRPYGVPSRIPGPLGIQFGGFRRLLLQDSGDNSFYNGMNLRLTKRFSKRFMADGFYTFSKATSDSDNFREGTALHFDPTNYHLDHGLSDQDRRHNFSMNGVMQLPFGIQFSAIAHATSGIHYSPSVGSDAMGIATTRAERPGFIGRNTYTGPYVFNIDSSLLKSFKIKERQRVDFRADMFNSLNRFNVTGINAVSGLDINNPVATFGRPTSTAAGRQFQFSGRYSF